jgi:hypothetical protein
MPWILTIDEQGRKYPRVFPSYEEYREHANMRQRKWRTPGYVRKDNLNRRFGMTPEDYDNMIDFQGGVCAICKNKCQRYGDRLSIDHNHSTGLLCENCNRALGLFYDNVGYLERAVRYLNGDYRS